jgi:hypothetical protein
LYVAQNCHGRCGHLPPGLLGLYVHEDAPGFEDANDAQLPPCSSGRDLSRSILDAIMVVVCALKTMMKMRTKGRTCFLWNSIVDCGVLLNFV